MSADYSGMGSGPQAWENPTVSTTQTTTASSHGGFLASKPPIMHNTEHVIRSDSFSEKILYSQFLGLCVQTCGRVCIVDSSGIKVTGNGEFCQVFLVLLSD